MKRTGGRMVILALMILCLATTSLAKVSLYLSSDQTEALYGIKTDGLYYVREGVVNKYAMNFQHQVIPADVDHIDFTWKARPGSSVPYKLTFIHTPGPAMAAPSVNISQTGLVPTYLDKFRLYFPCTGKVAAQVETLLQITLAIKQKSPEVLNFKRRKVCKLAEVPAHELVSDPVSKTQTPSKSVLLASVSPSLFITLGAASASVILLVALVAALYIRRVRKRDSQMSGGGGSSLRSSLQLNNGEEDYMEKTTAHTVVSSSDSYDTLASFTNVPVSRAEAPAWASHYTTPSLQTEYACPLPKQDWRTVGDSRTSLGPAGSPLVGRHPPPHPPSHMGSIHSSALASTPSSRFYSSERARGQARVRPVYSREEGGGGGGGSYRQYQYTSAAQPGDASPYSVSSELYKHVLPQYFQFSRPTSRGSVLV